MRSSLPTLPGAFLRPLGAAALATALCLPVGAAAWTSGATIAGVMAAHVRRMGYSARAHSNAHSELLHLPAVAQTSVLVCAPFVKWHEVQNI